MSTIAEILVNPLAYGFEFVSDVVRTDNGRDVLGNGPILTVRDVLQFEASFPGKIAASLDGSSFRVISQRVIRDMLKKNRRAEWSEMCSAVLSAILGIRQRTAQLPQLPPDYSEYLAWKASQTK
jgi:hypothetical protein